MSPIVPQTCCLPEVTSFTTHLCGLSFCLYISKQLRCPLFQKPCSTCSTALLLGYSASLPNGLRVTQLCLLPLLNLVLSTSWQRLPVPLLNFQSSLFLDDRLLMFSGMAMCWAVRRLSFTCTKGWSVICKGKLLVGASRKTFNRRMTQLGVELPLSLPLLFLPGIET